MSPPPLPRELQVEVTAACNLRCHMCLVRYRPPVNRVTGSLGFDRFREIVDAVPDLEKLTLQGLGEPLLAPDLLRMIGHATARGVRTGFNTNATLLTRAMAERLVDAGLEWLCISLDGARPETYESIRDGAHFGTVERHVRELVEVMRRRGATRPELSIVMVAMRRNVAELPDVVARAAEWGVPTVRVQSLSHSFSDTESAGDYVEIQNFTAREALWSDTDPEVSRIFDAARRRASELGVRLRLPELAERPASRTDGTPGCAWPWTSAYVRRDGLVQPCCMLMGDDRGILGDAAQDGFAAVWRSAPYEAFRAALKTATPPEVCAGCSMYRGVF
jgi:MoaA/NifB/PqqE/SkfB family radical SAM enzyme